MSDITISVVIPTWNRTDLLLDCLGSLRSQSRPADEIIVVDDGSTEDIAKAVADRIADVRVIRLAKNSGFCVAANTGLRAVTQSHVFLCNNDMVLAPDCLERLAGAAEQQPNTVLTPLVVFRSDPSLIYSAGDRILRNGRPESIGFRTPIAGFTLPGSIFGATGGAMFLPRAVLDDIGYFDETFVAYFEDADLCMRARTAGYEFALVPGAVAQHVGSASLSGKTWWRSSQCFGNHARLILKNYPVPLIAVAIGEIAAERVHQARMAFSSARAEFGAVRAVRIVVGVLARLARGMPHLLRERARIQRRRVLNSKSFDALLTSGKRER